MDTLKKFMIVLNNADKYPTEHELAEAALVARGKLNRLVEQRDAALKLADRWAARFGFLCDTQWQASADMTAKGCADELRAIFALKEGK